MAIKLKESNGNVSLTTPVINQGAADLTNYYTKSQTDSNIEQAIQGIDFSPYATKLELEQYDTSVEVDKKIEAIEIPETDLTGYAKESWVTEQINGIDIPEVNLEPYALKTDIPDVSNFATKSEIPDVSAYQTEAQVNTLISNALGNIGIAEEGTY